MCVVTLEMAKNLAAAMLQRELYGSIVASTLNPFSQYTRLFSSSLRSSHTLTLLRIQVHGKYFLRRNNMVVEDTFWHNTAEDLDDG